MSSYDVIVIGSGAGRCTLVHRLAFPSIGAVNPALTAMANGLRVGDHLLERLAGRRNAQEAAGAV
jgi:choline dehydrogenase-like flavoprotein